jgi:outer membrane protein TolC
MGALAALLASSAAPALTLEEAIALALSRNERAKIADESVKAADARVARARSFFFPDLTLTGDYVRRSHETTRTVDGETSVLQTQDGLEGRLTLAQPILDAQAFPLLSSARRSRDAAELAALDEKRRLAYEAADAFLAVLAREQVSRAAEQRVDLARRNLEEIRVRQGAGLVGSNDATRAELELASAERERVDLDGAASIARLNLSYLLDAPIQDPLVVPIALFERASQPADSILGGPTPEGAQRHDVLAEKARVESLEDFAKEPLMRYVPDLDFIGTAWSTNESGFSGRDQDYTLGLGLNWELFDGGERHADRGERLADARAAALGYAQLERSVDLDVETSEVELSSEQGSLASADVALDAARRNADETTELYRQGLVRALEVVDANVQLFSAEVQRVGAQLDLALAYLGWRLAMGLPPLDDGSAP